MEVESQLELASTLQGLSGATGDLLKDDGTSIVRITGVSQGSLLYRDASAFTSLAPGTSGYLVQSNGAAANPSYVANPVAQDRYAPPQIVPHVSDRWYPFLMENLAFGAGSSTSTLTANRTEIALWRPTEDLSVTSVGIVVTGAVAASEAKVLVYDATTGNLPGALLYASDAMDTSTTGGKTDAVTWTFSANTFYWVGVLSTGAITLSGDGPGQWGHFYPIWRDIAGGSLRTYTHLYKASQTFASPTDPWGSFFSTVLLDNRKMILWYEVA